MCGKYLKFGQLMEIIPEDYMVSLWSDGKELKHCIAWVLKQEFSFYKVYDTSVLSFNTDCYNEVCTIELKPSVKTRGMNDKLDLRFRRHF